jgi:hypothetical protein
VQFSGEQIEKVLDLVYDAAAENDLWPKVLTAIADLTNSHGSILFGQSMSAQKIYFDYNGRLDPDCNRAYQERHMQNPWSEHMEHQPVGRFVLSDEAIALMDLQKTAFYDDVLRPQQIAHNGMMAFLAPGFSRGLQFVQKRPARAFLTPGIAPDGAAHAASAPFDCPRFSHRRLPRHAASSLFHP